MTTHSAHAPAITPLNEQERIILIDSLRGIALCGILMMNIPGFGMPKPAFNDPTIFGEIGTINFKVWYFIEWFLEGSQRALFSILFGAGILVFTSRLEKRTSGVMPAELFFRRQLWLLLFGLFNAFVLLWFWDILFMYALAGMFLFAFRRLEPKYLIIAAIACLGLQTARENRDHYLHKQVIEKGEAIAAMDTTKVKLTIDQKDDLGAMKSFKERNTLESRKKEAEKQIRMVQGDYGSLYASQSEKSQESELFLTYFAWWDVLLFMFLGMAFFKLGILQGEHPMKTYALLAVVGLGFGLFLSYVRLEPLIKSEFNWFDYTRDNSFSFYEISRSIRAVGIFGLIMVVYKTGAFNWLFKLIQPVGQMAFTNYLMQSFVCGIIFYGIGFGLYGKIQRYELYYVVGGVWIFQIIVSNIWLRYFRFGPMEWLWRSLTYWEIQPFRKVHSEKKIVEAATV